MFISTGQICDVMECNYEELKYQMNENLGEF